MLACRTLMDKGYWHTQTDSHCPVLIVTAPGYVMLLGLISFTVLHFILPIVDPVDYSKG